MRNIPLSIILVAVLFIVLLGIFIYQSKSRSKARTLHRADSDDADLVGGNTPLVSPPVLILLFLTGGAIAVFVLYLLFQTFGS